MDLNFCIGAAFTRFQTLRLQKKFPAVLSEQLISYGMPHTTSFWNCSRLLRDNIDQMSVYHSKFLFLEFFKGTLSGLFCLETGEIEING